jgi:hypothetical protein
MKKIYFLLVFFGALLFCACEKESFDLLIEDQSQLEDSALKGAKNHAVPFKASFETFEIDEDYPDPDDGAAWRSYAHGIGNASHLGKTILWQDQRWFGSDPENVGWGDMILTAANGDELWSVYTSSHLWDEFPFFNITGDGVVTGGTGRFENATGTFTMVETWHLFEGVGTSVYNGKIRY